HTVDFEIGHMTKDGVRTERYTPQLLTYRFGTAGFNGTLVIMEDEIAGTLRHKGVQYEIGGLECNQTATELHVIFDISDAINPPEFHCGMDEAEKNLRSGQHAHAPAPRSQRSSVSSCVEVALDIDFYTYNSFNQSCANSVEWSLALLAGVSEIYETELDNLINLSASYVNVWEVSDPYASFVGNAGAMLDAFRLEWLNNPDLANRPRDLIHLMTRRPDTGTGGIAYLNVVCSPNYAAGFSAYLNPSMTYNLNNYSWNLNVVAHELGHNFGSNHTHWCGWPGGPIDNCGSLEGDCGGYTNNPTGQLGTIMSYCHAIAGGSKNLIFHPLVEDNALIPTFNSASCIGSCGPLVTESTDLQCGDATACNYTAGDVGTAGCVYAGECAECGPDGNVVGGLELDNLTATLAGTGSQSYTFDADGTVSAINITLDFNNPQSGSSWPGDMLLVLCTPNGSCVQVGGYDVDAGFPSVGAWPSGWNTSAAGIYSASVSLDASAPSGAGTWTVQLINGWSSSGVVEYVADFQFPGLCTNDSDIPGCTDPSACNHDPLANLEDGSCLYDDALGVCGGDCSADANANGICDDAEACGESACGEGTHWDAAMGLCRSNLITCMGDLDFNGIVNVNDALAALGGFGDDCGAPDGQSSCPSQMCCNEAACGTGTIWDPSAQECIPTDNCPGDVDLDGIVTVSDILDVLSAFGDTCE
ncbi:MAG: M12 family metallo-peptidase, partial [Flavobacteriales bacterium]|nr:M12 family metallo-peptidase [Flavobacteriales bacterium]